MFEADKSLKAYRIPSEESRYQTLTISRRAYQQISHISAWIRRNAMAGKA